MFTCDKPERARIWSWVDAHSCDAEGSCLALGGGEQGAPPHPSESSPPALTLRTVSLGVDDGSGSEHSTAGPRDRSSHLLGEMGVRGCGGKGRGSISPGRNLLGSPSLFSGKTG